MVKHQHHLLLSLSRLSRQRRAHAQHRGGNAPATFPDIARTAQEAPFARASCHSAPAPRIFKSDLENLVGTAVHATWGGGSYRVVGDFLDRVGQEALRELVHVWHLASP